MAYIDKSGYVRSSANPADTVRLGFPSVPRAASYYKPTKFYTGTYEPGVSNYSTSKDPNDYIAEALGFLPINTKYLSNTTNGLAMNSFADAIFNMEAKKKKWEGTVLDPSNPLGTILHTIVPIGTFIDTVTTGWETIVNPVVGSIKMANANKNDNFDFWDGLTAGLGTSAMNTLVNIGNTLDIIANPIKGAIIETVWGDGNPLTGFQRGLYGDSKYGRKQYDYSDYVDNFAGALALEFISDPINWFTLGAKGGISAAAKGGTTLIDDAIGAATDVLSKGITKEVIEEVVPEFGESVIKKTTSELGEEAAEAVAKSTTKRTVTKYLLDDGTDAVSAVKNAFGTKFNISDDAIEGMVKYIAESDKPVAEAIAEFTKSAKSSAASVLRRFATNPELARKLLNETTEQSKLAKVLGVPELHKLPNDVGEAVRRQLINNRSLRGAAGKWAGFRGWTPTVQTFAGEALQDLTIDQLPSLARLSKVYNNADFTDALLRNIALRGTGADLLIKGGTKVVGKGLGHINNLRAAKYSDAVRNTTDWLLKASPEHVIDFSKHGDVTHVTLFEADLKTKLEFEVSAFKELDDVLNSQRDILLGKSFLQDSLDVTGLQKLYDEQLAVVNKTIAANDAFKKLNINNIEQLVKYLNKVETDDDTIKRFIKKLNDAYSRLSKPVTAKDLETYLDTLKGIAELAQREGTSTVTDNIEIQNIIDNSAISKTISEARYQEGLELRYEAKKKLDAAKKALTSEEEMALLNSADAIAEDVVHLITETNNVLESIYKNYPGTSTKAALFGDSYDNFFDALAAYEYTRTLADTADEAAQNTVVASGTELAEALRLNKLDAATRLTVAYDDIYKHLQNINLDSQGFSQATIKEIGALEGYVRSLNELPKEVFAAQARLNSVDIDSIASNQLTSYVLGLSKRGLLMSLLDGEGTEGAYFARLLDDYDTVDNSVIRKLLNQEFEDTVTDNDVFYEIIKNIPEQVEQHAINKLGLVRGTTAYLEYMCEAGYIIKTTRSRKPSLYATEFADVNSLLKRLSKTRKLLRDVRDTLNKGLDAQHVECFMDEFISKGLETPHALLPENIGRTITECFEGAEIKLGSYLDVPKLTQDYKLEEIIRSYTTVPADFDNIQRDALNSLIARQHFAHDSLVDVENWVDAFVKLDKSNRAKLKTMTADGRYIVALDIETTGLLNHPSAGIYQIAAKVIDADGNEILTPMQLHLQVRDLPDPTVLNKLFKSADPEEISVLKAALNVDTVSAEDWFKHTYIDCDHPYYNTVWADQKDLSTKAALNKLFDYISEARGLSSEGLMPVLAGHNIKDFDISMLSKKAYANKALQNLFDEAAKQDCIFDTYDMLQNAQFWRVGSELIDSYIPQLSNIISKMDLPDLSVRQSVFSFSDVQRLSEFKSILNNDQLDVKIPNAIKAVVEVNDKVTTLQRLTNARTSINSLLNNDVFHSSKHSRKVDVNLRHRCRQCCSENIITDLRSVGVDEKDLTLLTLLREQLYDQTGSHDFSILKFILEKYNTCIDAALKNNADVLQQAVDNAIKHTASPKAFTGTADEVVDFINNAIEEVNNQWRSISKIRGAAIVYTFSKAGLGPEGLFQLWQDGIISVPGWRNIMSMLFHDTDARALVMLNPRTIYSYTFENFYDKELIKKIHGSGEGNRYVSKKVLEKLTKNSQRMSRIKKGILTRYVEYHYDDAYELLNKAASVKGTKHMYDLAYVDLNKLPKANVIAYAVANYNDLQELFKFYNEADALIKLEKFKDFDSLHNALPDIKDGFEVDAHGFVKQVKTLTLSKTDNKGNLVGIITGQRGNYSDIADIIKNADNDAELTIRDILQYNNDEHLHTATAQAKAYLYRSASSWQGKVNKLFKNASPERRARYFKQISMVDEVYSKAALEQFLNRPDAAQRFIEEARLSAGRKAFFAESEIDLTAFKEKGIITKVIPTVLEDGRSGYLHLLAVPMKDMQDTVILKHELASDIVNELKSLGIDVVKIDMLEDGNTSYKYIFNNATELSKEVTDAKIIDDIEAAPELKQLIEEWRSRDAARIKNIGYTNGDVLTNNIINRFDELLGSSSKELISTDTLEAFGYFDDLKANNLVIGSWGVQNKFNEYACSDFIRRHAYNTVNYIDTQFSNVTRYLNMLCNNENGIDTGWFKNLNDKDLYEALKNNKDVVLVYVHPSDRFSQTASGLVVERLNIVNEKSIALARKLNAHIVPAYSAYTMIQAVNTFKLPKLLRIVQDLSMLYKVGYLSSVGWLVRNFIDSNYKNRLDFKDTTPVHKQVLGLFNTMRLVMDYTTIVQNVGRNLDNALEYKALWHLCSDTPEALTKLVENNKTLARYIKRFQNSLTDENIAEISKRLIDVNLFEITDLFIKNGPAGGIAKGVINNIPTTTSATQKLVKLWTEKLPTKLLFNANELIEQSARLQSYMLALQHGASLDEAVARVLKTHFDYSDKSLAMLYTELVFPFMSFSFKNLEYWIDTLYSKGLIAGELENIFRCVLDYHSLYTPDYEAYRNYDYRFDFEKDIVGFESTQPWQLINAARLYHMLSGNLVWDTDKDVEHDNGFKKSEADLLGVFKLSPSILDAVNMLYMPLDQFQQRMLPPYEVLLHLVESKLTGDSSNLREDISINGILNNLPFVGAILQRTGVNADGTLNPNNIKQRIEDAGLYQAISSLVTAAYVPHKKYNTWYGDDNEYLTKLPQYQYKKSPYYYSKSGGFKTNYSAGRLYGLYYNPNTSRYRLDTLARSPYYKSPYSPSKKYALKNTYYSSLTYNSLSENLLKKRVLDKHHYT